MEKYLASSDGYEVEYCSTYDQKIELRRNCGGKEMPVSEKDNERVKRFIHENYVWVNIHFNRQDDDDMKIYNWLEKVAPSGRSKKEWRKVSKSAYIKQLILDDINRNKE